MEAQKSEGQVVAELFERYHEAKLIDVETPDGKKAPGVIFPGPGGGFQLHGLKKLVDEHRAIEDIYRDKPERRTGTAVFSDLSSFVAHTNRFADDDSALFANPGGDESSLNRSPTLMSVLDYHKAGATSDPRFGKHRGQYVFPLSEEWKAWVSKNEKLMTIGEFAQFLEDRLLDIVEPKHAMQNAKDFSAKVGAELAASLELLRVSRSLTVYDHQKCTNAVNPSTGEVQFTFESEHTNQKGGKLNVPTAFLIGIPLFRSSSDLYQIPARLRYRKTEHVVQFFYSLYKPARIFDAAFKDACDRAAEETGKPLFLGTPEG